MSLLRSTGAKTKILGVFKGVVRSKLTLSKFVRQIRGYDVAPGLRSQFAKPKPKIWKGFEPLTPRLGVMTHYHCAIKLLRYDYGIKRAFLSLSRKL